MIKILFIIAHENYQDKEFLDTKKELEGNFIEIASSEKTEAKGVFGGICQPDLTTKEALQKINEYNAVILIGGGGAVQYFNDPIIHEILNKMNNSRKIIAAICISPVVLAQARLLRDREATVWNGDGKQEEVLAAQGAKYVEKPVVVDTRIITANGPPAAKEFGKTIADMLKE